MGSPVNPEFKQHNIAPVYSEHSRILILGSFPSVRSREDGFYYAHPANRFWRVLARLFSSKPPQSTVEKKDFLLKNGIALWDVISSCELVGSSDSSIKNVKVNDISRILECADIKEIYTNGSTAKKYYDRYLAKTVERQATLLPSSSAANASFSEEKLVVAWSVILK